MVAGVAPLPFGGRTLAIDPGPYDAASAASTAKAHAARPNPVVTPKRDLPGGVSRDRAIERPHPKTTKSTKSTKPKPATPKTSTPSSSPTTHQSPWTCAVAACQGRMSSGFGARVSPGGIGTIYHQGDDFAVAWGTPLVAMHSGTIVSTGWVPGLGNHVTINYGDGVESVYGHMSQVQVRTGQWVGRGQLVGHSGNTGNSTGPHLHLEIHLGGVPVNPAPWLQARGIF